MNSVKFNSTPKKLKYAKNESKNKCLKSVEKTSHTFMAD